MNVGWEEVRLGEVMERSSETIPLEIDQTYREVTVKWWGKGAVVRREVKGVELSAPFRFVARPGQFIVSRIDARQGASDIIPPLLNGAIVTNDFPLFNLDESRLLPGFFRLYTRTADFTDLAKRSSEGTTNRVRLVERLFLDSSLSIPPLEEQKRIVSRVERLMAKVDEARGLREQARGESALLGRSARNEVFSRLSKTYPTKRFEDIADIQLGKMLSEKAKTGINSKPYLRNANIQWGRVDLSSVYYMDFDEFDQIRFLLQPNDILVCEGGNIGQAAMWNGEIAECYFQKALHRVRMDANCFDASYVLHHLFWNAEQKQYDNMKKQSTIAHLPLRQIKAHPMISPPLHAQKQAIAELSGVGAHLIQISQLQTQSQLELDALPASILARAFAGEL